MFFGVCQGNFSAFQLIDGVFALSDGDFQVSDDLFALEFSVFKGEIGDFKCVFTVFKSLFGDFGQEFGVCPTIVGLTSGTKMWARVRAVGAGNATGPWSDPATKVVP